MGVGKKRVSKLAALSGCTYNDEICFVGIKPEISLRQSPSCLREIYFNVCMICATITKKREICLLYILPMLPLLMILAVALNTWGFALRFKTGLACRVRRLNGFGFSNLKLLAGLSYSNLRMY